MSDAGTTTSDSFGALVGGGANQIADAGLGVYIHAFGDRTSHHVCLDQGYLYGPTNGGAVWQANMTNDQCVQGLHSLRHMWETGVDYTLLAAQDQTTIAYLGNAYDELVAFATARGVLAQDATDANYRAALVSDLQSALYSSPVSTRLAMLHAATCARGLTPFPGEAPCTTTSDAGWGDAGTGARGSDAGPGGGDASSGTAGAGTGGSGPGLDSSGGKTSGCSLVAGHRDGLGGSALASGLAVAVAVARRRRRASQPVRRAIR